MANNTLTIEDPLKKKKKNYVSAPGAIGARVNQAIQPRKARSANSILSNQVAYGG